jgi:hypothetical protein
MASPFGTGKINYCHKLARIGKQQKNKDEDEDEDTFIKMLVILVILVLLAKEVKTLLSLSYTIWAKNTNLIPRKQ